MFILLFNILFSFSLQALDCSEEKQISLFDKGKVLAGFKTQDQDGLGTCYANALSVALKASHKDHPDISYIDASFKGSSSKLASAQSRIIDTTTGRYFNRGGNACETFNKMKELGGACPSRYSILENNPGQEYYLNIIGRYLDHFSNKTTKSRADFKRQFKTLLEKVNELKLKMQKTCLEEKQKGFSGEDIVDKFLRMAYFTATKPECKKGITKWMRNFYTQDSKITTSSIIGEFNEEIKSKLRRILSTKEMEKQGFNKYSLYQATHQEAKKKQLVLETLRKIQNAFELNKLPENCAFDIFPEEVSEDIFESLYGEWIFQTSISCDYVSQSRILEKMDSILSSQENPLTCMPEDLRPLSKEILYANVELKKIFGENAIDKMFDLDHTNVLDQLQKITMPDCLDRGKLISLQDLKCSLHPIGSMTTENVPDTKKMTNVFRELVYSRIKNNQGIVVSICTSFLGRSNFVKTNNCVTNLNPIKEHDFHAMAVTGYRCKKGKIQYQLQNSWGSTCGAKVVKNFKNGFLECEVDKKGRTNGRLWVDEEVLVDSTLNLSTIDPI